MTPREQHESVARFFADQIPALLQLSLGERPSAERRALMERVAAVVVDRLCLEDSVLLWEDFSNTPQGLCALLDGLDSLEHAALSIVHARGPSASPELPSLGAISEALDELRTQCVRLSRSRNDGSLLDFSPLERLTDALFVLSRDRSLAAMNAAARQVLAERTGRSCHEVFFDRAERCDDCPLDEVLDGWQQRHCPSLGAARERVGLGPLAANSAIAFLAPPPAPSVPVRHDRDAVGAALLESIGSGVLFADGDGRIVFVNGLARELFGGDVTDERLEEVVPGLELLNDGQQRRFLLRRASGELQIGYRCVPCTLEGTRGTVVTFRDITELLRMKDDLEKLQRLSEVGRMCALVAHEIRNPLAGIMATIQSIETEAEAAGLREPLDTVRREVTRLAELLTSFFGFVRQVPPRRRLVDLRIVVSRARLSAGRTLDGVELKTDLDALPLVRVDPDQLQQVLLNLLLNAADATQRRGTIAVRATVAAGRLHLEVEDDGCGIAPHVLDHVFDAFFTTKPRGTGLGLSVCYRIVAAHDGTIRVESEPRRGTTVLIEIPLPDNT